jgi:G3E family GTPase
LIGIKAFSLERTLEMDPECLNTDAKHEHDPSVSSCSTKFEGFLNVEMLSMWIGEIIQTMGANLFRYKGVLSVAGKKEKFVFQVHPPPHPRPCPPSSHACSIVSQIMPR